MSSVYKENFLCIIKKFIGNATVDYQWFCCKKCSSIPFIKNILWDQDYIVTYSCLCGGVKKFFLTKEWGCKDVKQSRACEKVKNCKNNVSYCLYCFLPFCKSHHYECEKHKYIKNYPKLLLPCQKHKNIYVFWCESHKCLGCENCKEDHKECKIFEKSILIEKIEKILNSLNGKYKNYSSVLKNKYSTTLTLNGNTTIEEKIKIQKKFLFSLLTNIYADKDSVISFWNLYSLVNFIPTFLDEKLITSLKGNDKLECLKKLNLYEKVQFLPNFNISFADLAGEGETQKKKFFVKVIYAGGKTFYGNFKDEKCHNIDGEGIWYPENCVETKYYNYGRYTGELKNGIREGKGKFEFYKDENNKEIEEVYDGEWVNDKKHGKGKYTYYQGDIYEGNFNENEKHGKGKYSYKNNCCYEGNWFKGKKHGQGKFSFPDGSYYEGIWDNDIFKKGIFKFGKDYKGNLIDQITIEEGDDGKVLVDIKEFSSSVEKKSSKRH